MGIHLLLTQGVSNEIYFAIFLTVYVKLQLYRIIIYNDQIYSTTVKSFSSYIAIEQSLRII